MNDVINAKAALDSIVSKSRAHLYKPMQIAEILRKHRLGEGNVNPLQLESYRIKSKVWRDEVSLYLVGNASSSSAKFQDNLFESNAIPPRVLAVLAEENNRTGGAVEAYIYGLFAQKLGSVTKSVNYCLTHDAANFSLREFLNLFWAEPGLRRSVDKVFESVVFALFSTIVIAIEAEGHTVL